MEYEGDGAYGFKEHYRKTLELGLVPNLADFYPILSGLDLQGLRKKSAECSRRVDSVYDTFIAERRRDRDRNGGAATCRDFLDSMLDFGFCDDQMRYLMAVSSHFPNSLFFSVLSFSRNLSVQFAGDSFRQYRHYIDNRGMDHGRVDEEQTHNAQSS